MLSRLFKNRKSFLIVRNLVAAEIFAYAVFLLIALSADWAELYEKAFLSNYISFTILEFIFLGLVQIGLIIVILQKSFGDERGIEEIISIGEHEKLEFKTSLRWDAKRGGVNKDLEKMVMKTITAFLNSEGGHLVIGVDDKGSPFGLETDFATLARADSDGFENHFNNLFSTMIGPEFRRFVKLSFHLVNGKTICLVDVRSSNKPAYLKLQEGEAFFVRTGNATTPLKMSETAAYVATWWRQR